ncbi:probable DNA-directed RNA polymerase [Primulina huaijiensis]|uniref:probable DNA-directed RNA polymerase n=1 Tax=Primulina huaijiensis TaxID=1492673 RepID=UPI003CC719B2
MSYLLLNEDLARKTNLIQHPDNKIQDVYMYMLYEFKEFLHHQINDKCKMEIIESKLDRKLIKSLFMPLIYGKTVISMDMDIREKYGLLLSRKDSYNLAKLGIAYLNNKYPDIVNFMKLISIISWFSSVMDRAVVYSITYFTTRQDYMSFIKEKIYVYERNSKKKRRVTIYVPSMERDMRKTQSSACANFIHPKDAYIAMKVVESLLSLRAPIYTVYDNFITTPPYVRIVPDIYTQVFINMGFPLKIINAFIKSNLISPYNQNNIPSPLYLSMDYEEPIPSDFLIDLLNSHWPENYRTKTKKQIWEKKVSDLVKYYNNYVDAVCDRKPQLNDSGVSCDYLYEGKWLNFKKLLENISYNYSVHY